MTATFTLAHFSDIHLGPLAGFTPEHWNLKRGLGFINWHRKRKHIHAPAVVAALIEDAAEHGVDHIAVTGDLVNIGLPAEYARAERWLAGLGSPQSVTVVPGNHDIYTRLRRDRGVERWRRYMVSDAFGLTVCEGGRDGFPFVRRFGGIALIGLNSAVPTAPAVASGRLGEAQLSALALLLDRLAGLTRIVLIHHPPLPGQAGRRRGLEDAAALDRVLVQHGAELVIHGHNHLDMLAVRAWRSGSIPVVGVASASAAKAHGREPLGRYNLFRVAGTGPGSRIELICRGLGQCGGPVVELARRILGQGDEPGATVAQQNLKPHGRHSVP